MKTNKSLHITKPYDNEEDICNFHSFASDRSERVDHKIDLRTELRSSKKKASKTSHSRVSTKNDSLNVSLQNGNNALNFSQTVGCNENNLLDLIESLSDKIKTYETEIKNLIDEKLQMQMTINNLQLANYNSLKQSARSTKPALKDSSQVVKSNESAFGMNRQYVQEALGLKEEMKVLNSNIERQKLLLEQNHSILDDTILEDRQLFNHKTNVGLCVNCTKNKDDICKLNEEKESIMTELQKLKEEFITLIEFQNKVQVEDESQQVENNANNLNDTNSEAVKTLNTSIKQTEMVMPNIEQFFILNNKFQLVDSEKNLFHMKRCKKFEYFKHKEGSNFNNPEEILGAFLEIYQNQIKNKDDKANAVIKIDTDLEEVETKVDKPLEKDTSYNISDTD